MNEAFLNLDPEKRERILHAAMEEFARKGYAHASTNEIVKKAGISKGLLFHYFDSKKGLFFFLYDQAQRIIMAEFAGILDSMERDIIGRWRQIGIRKLEMIRKYPGLFDFAVRAMADDSPEIRDGIADRAQDALTEGFRRMFENIDVSRLKEGLDIRCVTDIISWVAQGFSNREMEKIRRDPGYLTRVDKAALTDEFDRYMKLLQDAFYQ